MPAATAVPRPVAVSASMMRSRSMPVADLSRPSGLSPPPLPLSELQRGGELHRLQRRDLRHRAAEQDARDDLVLRQRGRGGEGDLRIERAAGDDDADLDTLDVGGGDEIEPRRPRALEGDLAAIEAEAPAGEAQRAADHPHLADQLERRGRAPGAQVAPCAIRIPCPCRRRRCGCWRAARCRAARRSARGRPRSAHWDRPQRLAAPAHARRAAALRRPPAGRSGSGPRRDRARP